MLVFRQLTSDEMKALKKIKERSKCGVSRTRARMILIAAKGQSCPQIAKALDISPQYVRRVVKDFIQRGLEAISPQYRGGRPRRFSDEAKQKILELTLCNPREIGYPWSQWSLPKLRSVIIERGIVAEISVETVRRILHAHNVSYQRTKTWKESNDPEFESKWERVKELYQQPPENAVVLCVDEFGPVELRPYAGEHWAVKRHPQRLPATYRRTQGVRHLLAYYDVQANRLGGWIYERKRGEEFLDFLKKLRSLYQEKLIIVMDNFSPHRRVDIRQWADKNHVELVFIATNASWMNRIECHFCPLRKFVLAGSYPRSHQEFEENLTKYLEWRNQQPNDKAIIKAQRRYRVA